VLRLTPYAHAIPNNAVGESLQVSAAGQGPWSLSVDMEIATTIRALDLSPSHPAEGQSYVGTVEVVCIPAGSSVRMSIVGTDGYTDSVLHAVPDTQKVGTFELWVPGAEAGVRDVVTVEILLPEGDTLTKTASLVFG
jgi:hypothetical protein